MVGEEKVLIIVGSSRNDGNSNNLVSNLVTKTQWDMINLNDYSISYYDYNHDNKSDDFLPLINNILDNYKVLVFVTPVYWYSMSGLMKVFFDRITDVLDSRKSNRFKNKYMCVLTSSAGDNLGNEFWLPFKKTAEYLGMNYLVDLHTIDNQMDEYQIIQFINKIKKNSQ